MTYSVYNIKVDNELSFTPGPTAGYVLGIKADGTTEWIQGGGGGGSGTSGTSGSSGSAGTSGSSGTSGAGSSGTSGTSGATGPAGSWSGPQMRIDSGTISGADFQFIPPPPSGGESIYNLTFSQAFTTDYFLEVKRERGSGVGVYDDPQIENKTLNGFRIRISSSASNDLFYYLAQEIITGTFGVAAYSGSSGTSGANGSSGTSGSGGGFTNPYNGPITINGPVNGQVIGLTLSGGFATMSATQSNFYTISLASGANTINATNIQAGQTINLLVTTTTGNTITFGSSIKQIISNTYTPTNATGRDILTFISFDSTNIYLVATKNFN